MRTGLLHTRHDFFFLVKYMVFSLNIVSEIAVLQVAITKGCKGEGPYFLARLTFLIH